MAFTVVSLIVGILIRLPALYIALNRIGFWRIEKGPLILLAVFSAFLGVLMPAEGLLDIGGAIFRMVLFALIITILMKTEFSDAMWAVIVAAVIESIMITVLMFSPISWVVAGMTPLTVP